MTRENCDREWPATSPGDAMLRQFASITDAILNDATSPAAHAAQVTAAERRVVAAVADWRRICDIGPDYYDALGRLADAYDALIAVIAREKRTP